MADLYNPKNLDGLFPCRCRRCQTIIDYVREQDKRWVTRCNDCNREDMQDEINEPFMPKEDE
jgi:hypothetical protein